MLKIASRSYIDRRFCAVTIYFAINFDVYINTYFCTVLQLSIIKTPKTYALGVDSDRVLVVSKIDGQLLVTIKVKDSDVKYAEITPKRFVFLPIPYFFLPYVSPTLSLHTVLFTVHVPAQLSSFVFMLQMGVAASDFRHDKRER